MSDIARGLSVDLWLELCRKNVTSSIHLPLHLILEYPERVVTCLWVKRDQFWIIVKFNCLTT